MENKKQHNLPNIILSITQGGVEKQIIINKLHIHPSEFYHHCIELMQMYGYSQEAIDKYFNSDTPITTFEDDDKERKNENRSSSLN